MVSVFLSVQWLIPELPELGPPENKPFRPGGFNLDNRSILTRQPTVAGSNCTAPAAGATNLRSPTCCLHIA